MESTVKEPAQPETQWLQKAREGDEAAFGELMQFHYENVYRLVFSIVRNEHDARDLCQEIWLKIWQQLPRYRGDSKFTTWLHPIATRRAIDHLRKRRRWFDRFLPYQRNRDDDPDSGPIYEPVSEEPDAVEEMERDERRIHLENVMATLPPKQRAVLALREIQGLSYDEIATTLKIRRGTVMSRLFHARRQLATKLRENPCD